MNTFKIGERIRELREARGLSLFELSLASGIREQTIRSWEAGRRIPSAEFIVAVSKALDSTPNDLLGVDKTRAAVA
jgi:transcriptional regulator with XRE-family HTH domain